MPRPREVIRTQLDRRTDGRVSLRVDLAGFKPETLEALARYLMGTIIRPAAEPTVTELGDTMLRRLTNTNET